MNVEGEGGKGGRGEHSRVDTRPFVLPVRQGSLLMSMGWEEGRAELQLRRVAAPDPPRRRGRDLQDGEELTMEGCPLRLTPVMAVGWVDFLLPHIPASLFFSAVAPG